MEKESKKEHKHIRYFNPDVTSLEQAHQDFSLETKKFNAGGRYENFNDFISDEAIEYKAMYLSLRDVYMNYDD